MTPETDVSDTPAGCGRRLIPTTIDDIAEHSPTKVFGAVPRKSPNIEEGFRDVTYAQLANAINKVAWWLVEELGRCDDFTTLALLAPQDFRYSIFCVAAVKAGYKVSFQLSSLWHLQREREVEREVERECRQLNQ